MQFQVPQFIEVEDKIFGPLTFKQFVFILGGIGMCYLFWRLLPLFVAIPLIVGSGSLAASLAFFEYNGRPFIIAMESAFYYFIHTKLYLWNNERPRTVPKTAPLADGTHPEIYIPKLSQSRLHELSWSLDIKERIASGIATEEEKGNDTVQSMHKPDDILQYLRATQH